MGCDGGERGGGLMGWTIDINQFSHSLPPSVMITHEKPLHSEQVASVQSTQLAQEWDAASGRSVAASSIRDAIW